MTETIFVDARLSRYVFPRSQGNTHALFESAFETMQLEGPSLRVYFRFVRETLGGREQTRRKSARAVALDSESRPSLFAARETRRTKERERDWQQEREIERRPLTRPRPTPVRANMLLVSHVKSYKLNTNASFMLCSISHFIVCSTLFFNWPYFRGLQISLFLFRLCPKSRKYQNSTFQP